MTSLYTRHENDRIAAAKCPVRLGGIGESPCFCQSSRGRNAALFRHSLECGVETKRQNNAYREVPTCICSLRHAHAGREPKHLISLLPYSWKAKSAKSRALPFASSFPLSSSPPQPPISLMNLIEFSAMPKNTLFLFPFSSSSLPPLHGEFLSLQSVETGKKLNDGVQTRTDSVEKVCGVGGFDKV